MKIYYKLFLFIGILCAVSSCVEESIDMAVLTSQVEIDNLQPDPESLSEDSISLSWNIPVYDNLAGYKVVHEIIFEEGTNEKSEETVTVDISDENQNSYTFKGVPGEHKIIVYVMDSEGNLSNGTQYSYSVSLSDLTSNASVKSLIVERVGDSIKLNWDMPDYEYLKGVKIVDELASFEIEVDDDTISEYFIPTYPGNNEIKVFAKDILGNYSPEADAAIKITDVYVLGGVLGDSIRYWKNGRPIRGVSVGYRGIFVEGNDVYSVGTKDNAVAYWKNGVPVKLTDGVARARGLSIFVEEGVVYVAGYVRDAVTNNDVVKYWVDGAETSLTDPANDADIGMNSIAVENGNVYVVGTENDTLKIWINGVETILTGEEYYPNEGVVCVENGNYYCASLGRFVDEGLDKVRYWENGIEKALPLEDGIGSQTYGIAVNNGDVCIPVFEEDPINRLYRYRSFINENSQILAEWSPDVDWRITCCSSNSGDFYVAGGLYFPAEDRSGIAVYWKNGEKVSLTDETVRSWTGDIFVAD